MTRKRTHEEYVELVAKENPNIEVLGTYVGANEPIDVRCNLDNYRWSPNARALYRGAGCPKCAGVAQKTHEEFVQDVYKHNPHLEVLGTYVDNKKRVRVRCTIHNKEWEPTGGFLSLGGGCRECYEDSKKMTNDEFVSKLYSLRSDITVLGRYSTTRSGVLVRCNCCGHEWSPTPNRLLAGTGCPECDMTRRTKSLPEFIEDLAKVTKTIVALGNYVNNYSRIESKCLVCNHIWHPLPKELLDDSGCPKCAKSGFHKHLPATFYVYEFDDYCGFGITGDYKVRSLAHKRNFKKAGRSFELLMKFDCHGQDAFDLEQHLKASVPICSSGIEGFKKEATLLENKDLVFDEIQKFCQSRNLTTINNYDRPR